MKRSDFIFTVGYQGDSAIVDRKSQNHFRNLDARELAEKGQFKSAVASAYFDRDELALSAVMEIYARAGGNPVSTWEDAQRLFGIFESPQDVSRVLYI